MVHEKIQTAILKNPAQKNKEKETKLKSVV